ncbi:hypothetical protein BB561_006404 [Smittium simulii]|uniref:SCP domain-containing protein n=1 Tax=Smittium simulii TaxID=133385 RepID=A0A2T9Y4K4_9FUNG|nr:hypothetical protein BB561_006404 [Smittium simulii]
MPKVSGVIPSADSELPFLSSKRTLLGYSTVAKTVPGAIPSAAAGGPYHSAKRTRLEYSTVAKTVPGAIPSAAAGGPYHSAKRTRLDTSTSLSKTTNTSTSIPSSKTTNTSISTSSSKTTNTKNFLNLVNDFRKINNMSALKLDIGLVNSSLYHSKYLNEINFLTHDNPAFTSFSDRLKKTGASCKVRCAENIGFIYGDYNSAFKAWVDSPGHKANILGNFENMVPGVIPSDAAGLPYHSAKRARLEYNTVAKAYLIDTASKNEYHFNFPQNNSQKNSQKKSKKPKTYKKV